MNKIITLIIICLAINLSSNAQQTKEHLTIEQILKTRNTFDPNQKEIAIEGSSENDDQFYKQMQMNGGYNADLVIKGKVIRTKTFKGTQKETGLDGIFTAYFVEVQEVLKGNYKNKMIVSYNYGGKYEDPNGVYHFDLNTYEFSPYIMSPKEGFFCFKTSQLKVTETNNDSIRTAQFYDCIAKIILDQQNKIDTEEACKYWDIPYTKTTNTVKKKK